MRRRTWQVMRILVVRLQSYRTSLYVRSLEVPGFFRRNLKLLAAAWIAAAGAGALLRLAFPAAPVHNVSDALPMLLAYSAIIAAPIGGFLLARSAFSNGRERIPLAFHLSFVGRWRRIDRDEALRNPLFGPVGFLASLLIGLTLNVVVRTGEYFVAVPGMSAHAPEWGLALFAIMTFDLVGMNFFYRVAFVMALRSIPLFPRMLLFVWLSDIFMQLIIAHRLSNVGLPGEVVAPLLTLLQGNVTKVLISIAIWLPYMMLSERVNLTYRSRLPA